jgi:hypothetical protein
LCRFRLYDDIHDSDADGEDDFLMVFVAANEAVK